MPDYCQLLCPLSTMLVRNLPDRNPPTPVLKIARIIRCTVRPVPDPSLFALIDSHRSEVYLSVCNDMKAGAMTATFTSRDFNRDPGSIKRAALSGPVFITDRNKPSLVVMAIKDYERLAGRGTSLLDVLMPNDDQDFDFEPPKARIVARPADLD